MGDRSNAVGVDEIAGENHAQLLLESAYAVNGSSTSELFSISLHGDGKPCSGLLDTGATRTILTSNIAQPTRLSDPVLHAYNGGVVETLGMTDVVIASGDHSCQCSCFIVPKGSQRVLFGQDVISELDLIAQAHVVNTAPVSIAVKADVDPEAQPARRPPFSVRDEIEKELKWFVDADAIKPVREASPWVSPIVPVRKHNDSLRLCVDYQQLNKNVVREHHTRCRLLNKSQPNWKILLRNRQHVREFESPLKLLVPQCTSLRGNSVAVRPENSASSMPIISTPTTVASATAATSVKATTPVPAAESVPADGPVMNALSSCAEVLTGPVPDIMPDPVLEVHNSSLGSSTSIMPAEPRRHSTRHVREPKRFIEEF